VRIQLALDLLGLDRALVVAAAAAPWVDIVEAGTPLIKMVGMESVRLLRKRFPSKAILADMKTADVGDLEVAMAAEAGASAVNVLAAAPRETLAAAAVEARARSVTLVADLIGVEDLPTRLSLLEELGIPFAEVHCGIDEQRAGKDPFDRLRAVAGLSTLRLAVAGGLGPHNLKGLPKLEKLEVVIVGGAITRASDPAEAARSVAAIVKREGG
jgi:3-hexulose-6-phosphate synthase